MRNKIIIANWKMNKDRKETIEYLTSLERMMNKNALLSDQMQVALAPSFLCLVAAKTFMSRHILLKKNVLNDLLVFAQDAHYEMFGAYTGFVSYAQLKEEGINGAIIGHAERRINAHETDQIVNLKALSLLKENMYAIVCIGEDKTIKESGQTINFLQQQVENVLKNVAVDQLNHVVIAYEPVYAINSNEPVALSDVEAVIIAIRDKITQLYNKDAAETVRIVYGGSINLSNYTDYVNSEQLDGLLIGKASLDVSTFYEIIYGTSQIITTKYPSLGNKYFVLKQKEIKAMNKELPEPKREIKQQEQEAQDQPVNESQKAN